MSSLNKVILIGRVGKEPESKQAGNSTVCKFSLATSEKYKGEEKTEWHNIELWGKPAEFASQYLNKGDLACVEGKIQTDKWRDQSGNDKYTTKIKAFSIQMLSSRSTSGDSASKPKRTASDVSAPDLEQDDIPF